MRNCSPQDITDSSNGTTVAAPEAVAAIGTSPADQRVTTRREAANADTIVEEAAVFMAAEAG